MTVLIIEDEPLAARQLADFIGRSQPDARILATLRSVGEAVTWFAQNPAPDLLFSDIELLDGNAFVLYERVAVVCPIIFTTAYDQFLLRAFQTNGIAYLLKPFTYEQFQQAVDKYQQLKTQLTGSVPALSESVLRQLQQALQPTQTAYRQRFTVKMRNGIYLLAVDDIVCLQTDEGVVFAYDAQQRKYPMNGTLTDLESQLDPARFFRLNRSDVIHIRYVERIEPYFGDRLAVHLHGQSHPLIASTTRTPDLRKWLEN